MASVPNGVETLPNISIVVRKNENDIVNARFASSVTNNRSRDFWQEVKRIRR